MIRDIELYGALRALKDNLFLLKKIINELRTYRPLDQVQSIALDATLETLMKEFEAIQKAGDEMIAILTPKQRKHFRRKIHSFFLMLGWNDRIDNNGNIIYDT